LQDVSKHHGAGIDGGLADRAPEPAGGFFGIDADGEFMVVFRNGRRTGLGSGARAIDENRELRAVILTSL
jgi:hypothetical protein